jgi:hypothetical protein
MKFLRRTFLGAMTSALGLGRILNGVEAAPPDPPPYPSWEAAKPLDNVSPQPPQIVSSFVATPESHYPFRQNMYRALQLPGECIIALSIARQEGQQTMQGRYSSDDGHHWSQPEDLFRWPRDAGGFALFDALVDHEGEIHIFILCDANSGMLFPKSDEGAAVRPGKILDIWHVRSRAKRLEWGAPKLIWKGHGGDLLSVIQLRNGRLLLPFAFDYDRSWGGNRGGGFLDFTYAGTAGVSALYSDDGGATWQQSPAQLVVQTPDLSTYGAVEPVVIELKDGRIWMLMRTQRGRFFEAFSSDGGVNWTAPRPSPLISSDSPAGLIRLKDGSILLFLNACLRYPYAYGGRDALHVAISKDEGRTWQGFREAARDPLRNAPPPPRSDYGLAYTFPTLLTDGKVLFSNWVQTGRERSFRLLDPAWVLENQQSTDFSQGLDDWSVYGTQGVELQSDPHKPGANALAVRKAQLDWPAGAVWNFPIGSQGRLKLELMVRRKFAGALLGLTDHFSVPWDLEDEFFNVFNIPLPADGRILPNFKLPDERWMEIDFEWDSTRRECRLGINGRAAGAVQDNRRSRGVNYFRVRSTATEPDGGILLRSLSVTVKGGVTRSGESFGT